MDKFVVHNIPINFHFYGIHSSLFFFAFAIISKNVKCKIMHAIKPFQCIPIFNNDKLSFEVNISQENTENRRKTKIKIEQKKKRIKSVKQIICIYFRSCKSFNHSVLQNVFFNWKRENKSENEILLKKIYLSSMLCFSLTSYGLGLLLLLLFFHIR